MTEEEKYLFDVQGYMIVEQALSAETVADMNRWIDEQEQSNVHWRRKHSSLLTWGPAFLALLDNAKVLPYLAEILGPELRLDHDYPIFSSAGAPPLELHGGGTPYDPAQYYQSYHGRIYSGLAVASYALADIPAGAGGFCCIPGSHKASFRLPDDIRHYRKPCAALVQVPVNAGDCVLFTEALTHGTLPWTAAHERRNLFMKYSPKHLSWARSYYFPGGGNDSVAAMEEELNPVQRALLDAPSVHAHRRAVE